MEQQIAGAVGTKKERNLGIELLRLVSMLMIVMHHCLGHGGFRAAADGTTESLAWLLTAACFGAVNLYALTTGYVCVKATHRWQRILELWVSVLFYSLLFSAVEFIRSGSVSLRGLIEAFLPMTLKRYWYFSAYFLLFFMIPLLNRLIHSLSKTIYRRVLLGGFLLLCGFGWAGGYISRDSFALLEGYSTLWLAYLYLIGAYVRLYESDFRTLKRSIYIYIYITCSLLTWLSTNAFPALTTWLIGKPVSNIFLLYISPTVTLGSICLFIFFSQAKIHRGKRFLLAISPCSFGIYLIHEHPYIRQLFIKDRFVSLAQRPWYEAIGILLGVAVGIFVVCLVIEYLRRQLFRLLRVSRLCKAVTERFRHLLHRLEAKRAGRERTTSH